MINARDSIRLMKHLGIVLITLPELVTTPIGLALILTARYLSKRLEARLYERLRETFRHYLAHYGRRGDNAAAKAKAATKTERSAPGNDRLIPLQDKGSNVKAGPALLAHQDPGDIHSTKPKHPVFYPVDTERSPARRGMILGPKVETTRSDEKAIPAGAGRLMRRPARLEPISSHHGMVLGPKVEPARSDRKTVPDADGALIRHGIDMQALSRRFKSGNSGAVYSVSTGPSTGTIARHSIDTRLSSRRREIAGPTPAKTEHHTIDTALLNRIYGAAALR